MFRTKLLAALFSILVAVAEEFSLFNNDTKTPKTELKETTIKLEAPSRTVVDLNEPAEKALTVSASVYFPVPGQTDSSPYITADGSKINKNNPKKHRWIAVSRDLHSRWGGDINYGDSLVVTGVSKKLDGMYIVRDIMNKRIRKRIDILVGEKDKVMGFWDDVKIAKVN